MYQTQSSSNYFLVISAPITLLSVCPIWATNLPCANLAIQSRSIHANPRKHSLKNLTLINSKTVFVATVIVVPTLILIVFASGINEHRSLYLNSLISTTILSVAFTLFITTGLYNGWKLKDTVGPFKLRINFAKPPDLSGFDGGGLDLPDGDVESIGAVLAALLLWVGIAIVGSVLLYYVGGFIWLSLLSLAAMLYWIIFRAFRLVFRHFPKCRGNLLRSFAIALGYTILYNIWIYAILFMTHFMKN